MKALVFERSLSRFAAAKLAGTIVPGAGAHVGPLRLLDVDEPAPLGDGWHRVRPLLSGICGSDLATVDGRSSRYFEPVVSFPFTPGHEVVGLLDDDRRVVLEPVLGCLARAISPPCDPCARGRTGGCENVAFGHIAPGLQTGYCADTGGGWGAALVAHDSQVHEVPDTMSDQDAMMIEPTACAVHAALAAGEVTGATVVVLGAGTLGLCTIAAVRATGLPGRIIAAAKHPHQREFARILGATTVADAQEIRRAVRRATRSLALGGAGVDRLTGGADVVIDCVGSAASLTEALAIVRGRGRVILVGMPGQIDIDLTPLWHREIELVGAYAYGAELVNGGERRTFEIATELVAEAGLGRLVSATYPLERYAEAIDHAANAGRRGAVKIAFDLRKGARREGAGTHR